MKDLRVIFFGTPIFACAILKTLLEESYNVVAVVCQPDAPQGRKKVLVAPPVKELALKHNIPVVQPVKLRNEVDAVLAYQPDLIITCAYGQMVPTSILEAPKYGCLNIHPSLLPKYRGGAPVHYAIWNGDQETGVCLMEMVKAMDAGKVYACKHVPIHEDETLEELNLELQKVSCNILKESLPLYLEGKLEGVEQDEEGVSICHNISRSEEQVKFHEEEINTLYNHVRAFIDWPISYGAIDGKRIKFYKASKEIIQHAHEPGTILGFDDDAMLVACIGGILHVHELQLQGKKQMDAKSFSNGAGRNLVHHVFE